MNYWGYPKYVSVAEKKEKAAKKLKQLKKKMPDINPLVIEGNVLARTWWAKSWNKNLERYADYSNRIGRGRSYVKHGAVLDLKIAQGKVTALVQGSTSKPYTVVVTIDAISQANWQTIKKQCEGKLTSLQDLLAGKFPKDLGETFLAEGKGLFPRPEAIHFDCSCPDWASMCKHVAAVLYGIGARFDEDPSLFFTLRGTDTGDLITRAIKDKTGKLLAKITKKSSKIIADADLADMFGIDMAYKPDFAGKGAEKLLDGTTKKTKTVKKEAATKIIAKSKGLPEKGPVKKRKSQTATDLVFKFIGSHKTGVNIKKLVEETGYSKTKLYGIVHSLKQHGKIKNKSQGVYVSA